MLYVVKNLETEEAAKAFNRRIIDSRCATIGKNQHLGCVGERACIHCYHIISDSICLCGGYFICPKCNKENGVKASFIPMNQINTKMLFYDNTYTDSMSPENFNGMYI